MTSEYAARTTRGDDMQAPAVPGDYVTGGVVDHFRDAGKMVGGAGLPTLDDGEGAAGCIQSDTVTAAGERAQLMRSLAQAGQINAHYASLHDVLSQAYHQAAGGKGHERHATDDPFDQQPIMVITRLLGDHSCAALGYQAVKKTVEAGRLHRIKGPDAAVRELYGAINYIAAMVLRVQEIGDIRDSSDSRTQEVRRGR